MSNFVPEKCSVWKILLKTWLVMITIIRLTQWGAVEYQKWLHTSKWFNPKRAGWGGGQNLRRCVIERWVQRKTDQKLIFNGNYTQIVFCVFSIHFHYVLSYLFGLFGVRTCVSILWHTSLPKNATLLEKIAKNHDFGNFWWFSCFLTWCHLWRHCGVIQGMFVLFLVPMDSGGS